jgi:cytochrome oxidase Cu insertion factor (SCO1/SenC/PrrC family)
MSAESNSNSLRKPASQGSTPAGTALPFILCGLLLIGIAYMGLKWYQVYQFQIAKSEALPRDTIGPPLTEFELTERSGKPFRSADMHGRVWVASYFFTTCPGQCLRLNANLQLLANEPALKDVTFVSITCDPDNDKIEALRAYADRFKADPERWLFCRGDLEYVQRIAKGMKVFLSLKGHQDVAIVIDKQGKMRGMFDATSQSQCQRMQTLLVECLNEKAPEAVTDDSTKEKSS